MVSTPTTVLDFKSAKGLSSTATLVIIARRIEDVQKDFRGEIIIGRDLPEI